MKPYTPLVYWCTNDIMRCANCQRVFTSDRQYVADALKSADMICKHRGACAKRRERLTGIHVKAWRDLCVFLDGQIGKQATLLQVPVELRELLENPAFYERCLLATQELSPIKHRYDGAWQLLEDWERCLQRIEQGELRRWPGDMEAQS